MTILSWALQYSGDYLVCREFFPELKVTTYKTFTDICPQELIIENRIADMVIKIKCADGGTSNIYFRPAEEPDKFRSMNLSGFYLDEANQISEEAFLILQGRLRGKGLRKGILTSNPKGHDYLYKWFVRQDHLNSEDFKKQFCLILAPSTENVYLPADYISSALASWSEDRIQREIYASFESYEGMVYKEFRRDVHVIRPFRIPANWKRYITMDHGYRAPAAAVFAAVSPDGEVYVYKEFYQKEWLIREIINGDKKTGKIGIAGMYNRADKFETARIDPATKQRRGTTGESDFDEYRRHWPSDLPPLQLAKNSVELGVDRVKQYLKVSPRTNKPLLYLFDTCHNLIEEMSTYKYPELKSSEVGRKDEKENPVKYNDHALDALRYLIIDLPVPYTPDIEAADRSKKYSNIEIAFQDEMASLKAPKPPKDPWQDGI